MDTSNESQKRQEFRAILNSLATHQFAPEDKREKAKMYERLESLYRSSGTTKPYRHFYTDIFNVFTKLESNNSGSAEVVCLNLACIRQGYQAKNCDSNGDLIDISESLKKLYDHASLEMARISYANNKGRAMQSSLEALDALSAALSRSNSELQDMKRSIRDAQKDYIMILGVFAAVVMVFFSGVGFSTSVLANLHQASFYRIWISVTLLCDILFNILWILFNFLREMVDKRCECRRIFIAVNLLFSLSFAFAFVSACHGWFKTI